MEARGAVTFKLGGEEKRLFYSLNDLVVAQQQLNYKSIYDLIDMLAGLNPKAVRVMVTIGLRSGEKTDITEKKVGEMLTGPDFQGAVKACIEALQNVLGIEKSESEDDSESDPTRMLN